MIWKNYNKSNISYKDKKNYEKANCVTVTFYERVLDAFERLKEPQR